jgi:hypothetical protein
VILTLFLVGTPIVAFIWESLNHLLSGQIEPRRLLVTVPVIVVFYVLLRIAAGILRRFGDPQPSP